MFRTNWDDLADMQWRVTAGKVTREFKEFKEVIEYILTLEDVEDIFIKKLIDEPHKCKDASYLINNNLNQLEYKETNDKKTTDSIYTSNSHIRNC